MKGTEPAESAKVLRSQKKGGERTGGEDFDVQLCLLSEQRRLSGFGKPPLGAEGNVL